MIVEIWGNEKVPAHYCDCRNMGEHPKDLMHGPENSVVNFLLVWIILFFLQDSALTLGLNILHTVYSMEKMIC